VHSTRLVIALALSTATASAQELLHYKFDGGCGDKVINYAAGSPAPNEGTIVTNLAGAPAASWKAGVWRGALTGGTTVSPQVHNYVDTGWNPGTITGSMTWASWIKMDPAAPTPSLTYMFGTGTNFRIFTGGGGFFLTSGWGGSNVNTVANIQTLARAAWTHLALVLDGSTMTGTYYVNGVPEAPVTLTSAVNWNSTAFFVGKHSSLSYPNIFDLDEFILANRAMSASEIAALAVSPRAGDSVYGSGGCGGLSLQSSGGAPVLGNGSYALSLNSTNAATIAVNVGSSRCRLLGVLALPFDLGAILPQFAGCVIETDQDVLTFGGSKGPGTLMIPFPIPTAAVLAGVNLYVQAPGIDSGGGNLIMSNACSIALGY